jgi:hypothetical protein
MYTFDKASYGNIIGRVVGEGGEHIAVTVLTGPPGQGFLLAVDSRGHGYVTWAYKVTEDGSVAVFWGNYFMFTVSGNAGDAFREASADLHQRFHG